MQNVGSFCRLLTICGLSNTQYVYHSKRKLFLILNIAIFLQCGILETHALSAETDNPYTCSKQGDLSSWINQVTCTRLKKVVDSFNGNLLRDLPGPMVTEDSKYYTADPVAIKKLHFLELFYQSMIDLNPQKTYDDPLDSSVLEPKLFDTSHIEDLALAKFFPASVDNRCATRPSQNESVYGILNPLIRALYFIRIQPFAQEGARGLAPTVRIGHSCVGTDKIGHFFDEGYDAMSLARRDADWGGPVDPWSKAGQNESKKRGIFLEFGRDGIDVSGVFSYADLESNLAGLQFAHELFESESPPLSLETSGDVHFGENLVSKSKGWIKFNHCPDVSKYFTDRMNEVFNPNVCSKKVASTFDMKSKVLIGLNMKIARRAKAMRINLAKDYPACRDLSQTSGEEKHNIEVIQSARSLNNVVQAAADKLAAEWALCPEKLSFHNVPEFDSNTPGNQAAVLSGLEIRSYLVNQLILHKLTTK